MHRRVIGSALIVLGLTSADAEIASPTPELVAFTETIPASIDRFERRLDASSWSAIPGHELVAAVLLPAPGEERPVSQIVLFSFQVLGGTETALALEEVKAWEQATGFEMMVSVESGNLAVGGGAFPLILVLAGIAAILVLAGFVWSRRRTRAA